MGAGQPLVRGLDHLVLTVRSIEETIRFYEKVLGLEAKTFGKGRRALHFGSQKLNLHQADAPIDANVRHATPGSADLCFIGTGPAAALLEHLRRCGVKIVEGPVERTGATGPIESIYFYDPDENLIEVGYPVGKTGERA